MKMKKNKYEDVEIIEFLAEKEFNTNSIKFFTDILKFTHLNYLQQEFLEKKLESEKVLVVAPTSSGKTIVAMLKMVLILQQPDIKKRFIYMIPYTQLIREKIIEFSVFEYFDLTVSQNIKQYQEGEINILICSFHQMDEYLQFNPSLNEPDLFILDELDVLGSNFFGPMVEGVIAHFIHIDILNNIISITATVGDMVLLANWLNKSEILEVPNYRPVPLIKRIIYNPNGMCENTLINLYQNEDDIKEHPILAIIYHKPQIESLAKKIAQICPEIDIVLSGLTKKFEKSSYINEILSNLKCGVGIYHADIPKAIQSFVVSKFNEGILPFLIASPSLARGVNLNCRTVVIRPLLPYGKIIRKSDYEQISGRAGRKGYQDKGYSIIFAKDESKKKEYEDIYIKGDLEQLESGFFIGEQFQIDNFELDVLKTIALNESSKTDLRNKYSNYFFVAGMSDEDKEDFLKEYINIAIAELSKMKFIERGKTKFLISKIGRYFISSRCSSIPGFGLKRYYQLVHRIGNKILENKIEITTSNYYDVLRRIINIIDDGRLIKYTGRKTAQRIESREKCTEFIRAKCGLFESDKFLRDLTFVVIVNFMLGRQFEEIEQLYYCSIQTFYKLRSLIPQIIGILRGFISEFFSIADDNEDEDWQLLLNYLKESIKGGIPFKHVPFRLNVKAKEVHRTAWLNIIYGLQNKYLENPLKSYQEIFEKESSFEVIPLIGPSRNRIILDKKDNVIRAENRLNFLIGKYGLDFNFKVKIIRPPS